MEKLIIILLIAIASWIHTWWKRRQEQAGDGPGSRPARPLPPGSGRSPASRPGGQPTPPVPTPASRWEEELRRLLQGDEASAPPAPQPARTEPTPAPPPLPSPPKVATRTSARAPALSGSDPDMDRGLPVELPTLKQSAQAYLHASQLEGTVAARLRQVDELVRTHSKPEADRPVPSEIRLALELVRRRESQRAAILAGVILGPPRGLEP